MPTKQRVRSSKEPDCARPSGLRILHSGDGREQEAGRRAASVMQIPQATERAGRRPRELAPDAEKDIQSFHIGGQPLPAHTRDFFEPRFGHDFSRVRVHTDARAESLVRSLCAEAFTCGQNVFFRQDTFLPHTAEGRHLLAHELAHTIQQESSAQACIACRDDIGLWNDFDRRIEEAQRRREEEERKPRYRVDGLSSGGWVGVEPIYAFISAGEPFELPHFTEVREISAEGERMEALVLEGRYKDFHHVYIQESYLATSSEPDAAATLEAVFTGQCNENGDLIGEFRYGNSDPVPAVTDGDNPTPSGVHDLEIPDYHHQRGANYGTYGTTWFRIGHSGDRYLHAGSGSAGCVTIKDIEAWPAIWDYLIRARQDDENVGTIVVRGTREQQTFSYEEPEQTSYRWTSIY